MIQHLFKLTWKKKRRNLLLVLELFFAYLALSFLIMFLSGAGVVSTDTAKFNIDNVVEIRTSSINDTLMQNLRSLNEVGATSLTNFSPYNNSLPDDTLFLKNDTVKVSKWNVDDQFARVMKLQLEEGRWFTAGDSLEAIKPVVITTTLKKLVTSEGTALAKVIRIGAKKYKVIGITADLNDPSGNYDDRPQLFAFNPGNLILLRLKQPMTNQMYISLKRAMRHYSPEFSGNIIPLQETKEKHAEGKKGLLFLFGGVSAFLIINVLLGLFSVLYQNINSRKSEIGLRKACGATNNQIYGQILLEVAALTTLALIPALLVASQIVIFEVLGETANYYSALTAGAIAIYILVSACAFYPARLAATIQPSKALHEE